MDSLQSFKDQPVLQPQNHNCTNAWHASPYSQTSQRRSQAYPVLLPQEPQKYERVFRFGMYVKPVLCLRHRSRVFHHQQRHPCILSPFTTILALAGFASPVLFCSTDVSSYYRHCIHSVPSTIDTRRTSSPAMSTVFSCVTWPWSLLVKSTGLASIACMWQLPQLFDSTMVNPSEELPSPNGGKDSTCLSLWQAGRLLLKSHVQIVCNVNKSPRCSKKSLARTQYTVQYTWLFHHRDTTLQHVTLPATTAGLTPADPNTWRSACTHS